MSKLVWDQTSERRYETGIEQVAFYPQEAGAYNKGYAWNGVTAFNLTPSGAEPTPLYANNRKYLTMMSAEEMGATLEAYTYEPEFRPCMGYAVSAEGVYIGQQARKTFGLVAKTLIGNDTEMNKHGYTLHLLWGCLAAPSEQSFATVNDSPEAVTFSWEISTTPVAMTGFEPTSYMCINSTEVDAEKLKALEAILYGADEEEARLPLPDEVVTLLKAAA